MDFVPAQGGDWYSDNSMAVTVVFHGKKGKILKPDQIRKVAEIVSRAIGEIREELPGVESMTIYRSAP